MWKKYVRMKCYIIIYDVLDACYNKHFTVEINPLAMELNAQCDMQETRI